MLNFLRGQTDFILLISGMGYALLAVVCLIPSAVAKTRLPWRWLGAFGLFMGISSWLDVVAYSIDAPRPFADATFCLDLAALLFLAEFARISFLNLLGRAPGRWLTLSIVACACLCWLYSDLRISPIVTLAFVGAVSASIAVALASLRAEIPNKWCLRLVSTILLAYAVVSVYSGGNLPSLEAAGFYVINLTKKAGIPNRALLGLIAGCLGFPLFVHIQNLATREGEKPKGLRSALIVSSLLIASVSGGWVWAECAGNQTNERLLSDLLSRTIVASSMVNPHDVSCLSTSPKDVDTPAYQRLKQQLRQIKATYPNCRFAYITTMVRDKVFFLVDAEPENSPDYSPPGQEYVEASDVFKSSFARVRPFSEGPFTDRWGTWFSGLCGIRNPVTDRIVGSLGLDVEVSDWSRPIAQSRLVCIVITLLLSALTLVGYFVQVSARDFSRYIVISEKRYRSLVENSPNSIELFDHQGRCLSTNRAGLMSRGCTEDELIGKNYVDPWPEEARPLVADAVAQVLQGFQAKFEANYQRPDGSKSVWYVTLSPIENDNGQVTDFVSISTDITALKRAQLALAHEKERLAITLGSIGDGVIATDTNNRIVLMNRIAEALTGWSESEAIGRQLKDVFQIISEETCEPCDTPVDQVLATGEMVESSIPISVVALDGTIRSITDCVSPIRDTKGTMLGVVLAFRDITDKKMYGEKLNYLAHHDALTGLPNRILFSDRLAQNLLQAERDGQSLAVMFVDLDRFKFVNDTLGHNVGDLLLKEVAWRLLACLRSADTLARMGGDEFTIILRNIGSSQDSAIIAQRVLEALAAPFIIEGQELFISASIGISIYPSDGKDAETLVKNADTAMYRAKERGRSCYYVYTEALNSAAVERMTLEGFLRKATERDEFILHYQPQVNIKDGSILGVEALIRWQNPELGLVQPLQFIPIAEETGLIVPISKWVLQTACNQAVEWSKDGYPEMSVGVNISPRLFQYSDLVESVFRILEETGLEPPRLDLEVTETLLMQDPEHAAQILKKLKDMGVRISIDDFGTGYSSLNYLKRFPIDTVKIDRSFVRDITHDSDDAAIANAVIAMAHSLKLNVIAEGVETLEQLDFLRSISCDQVQGYFISPPVAFDSLKDVLTSYNATRGRAA